METDDLMEGVECIQDDGDVTEMSIIGNEEVVLSDHLPDYSNIKLQIDNDEPGKIKCDENMVSLMPDNQQSVDVLQNITASVASLQQTIPSNLQVDLNTCRIANVSGLRQVAIAPKPIGTINKTAVINTVKKISVSNLRPKVPGVPDSGPHLVVVPTSGGRIKVLGTRMSQQTTPSQVVNTTSGQVIQLRQGNTSAAALTKFAIVQGGDANTANASKAGPRYLSLQEAQKMGLVSGGKIQQIAVSPVKQMGTPTSITVRPQIRQATANVKSPAKILPAPPKGTLNATKIIMTSLPQNVTVKASQPITQTAQQFQMLKVENISGTGNTLFASLSPGQKIEPNQIHQINLPGKGVQLVRLLATTNMPQQQNFSNSSTALRIAPLTTTATRTLPTNSKIVPAAKTSQTVKPLKLEMQGNMIQITSADMKTILPTSASGVGIKKVTTQPKLVTLPIGVSANQKVIQTNRAVTLANYSIIQANRAKVEKESSKEEMEVQVSKTEAVEEEAVLNDSIGEDNSIAEEQPKRVIPTTSSSGQSDMKHIVMVPASYIHQMQGQNSGSKPISQAPNLEMKQEMESKNVECSIELGMRPRKPCNCTKSQCLKLYCDCFANGEFCNNCNCNNCYNNLVNEEFRQKAIRTCLQRNPIAFRPKIGKAKNYGLEVIRRHNKGCNCKRSGCLKNYCECYEGKIACSANCKCVGCRNIEDSFDKRSLRKARTEVVLGRMGMKSDDIRTFKEIEAEDNRNSGLRKDANHRNSRKPWNYMTTDVIEAVCDCLVAQAGESESFEGPDAPNATRYILEEFARCLQDMISAAQIGPTLPDDSRGLST